MWMTPKAIRYQATRIEATYRVMSGQAKVSRDVETDPGRLRRSRR